MSDAQRCPECNCENGGEDRKWVVVGFFDAGQVETAPAEGYRKAIEDAAKVADQYAENDGESDDYTRAWERCARSIAAAIRALAEGKP